jgi:hypothetical protein
MRIVPLAVSLLCAACAQAAPIAIQNASFETANLTQVGNGVFSQLIAGSTIFAAGGTLANWTPATTTINSTAGGFSPSPGGVNWTSTWWDGSNIGYLQVTSADTVSLSQTLSDTLQNNTVYSLSALIGRRSFTPRSDYAMQLWAGSTLLASASNLVLASNSFGTDSLTYSSGAGNPLAGQALKIVFSSSGAAGAVSEAFFDRVALDAVSTAPPPDGVPEPSGLTLSALGLGVLMLRRRA